MADLSHAGPLVWRSASKGLTSYLDTLSFATSAAQTFTVTQIANGYKPVEDLRLKVWTISGETVNIKGSVDGTNYSANLTPKVKSTGAFAAATELAAAEYLIPKEWPFMYYRITKSSATETCNAVLSAMLIPKS
jgi:uncharacterized protein (DUF2126 family)